MNALRISPAVWPAAVALSLALACAPCTAETPALDEKLVFEVSAYRVPDALPVYASFTDSSHVGSLLTIPRNPYNDGLSSVVLFATDDGEVEGLVAAHLTSPGNRLVMVAVLVENPEREPKAVRLGDLTFHDAGGNRLHPVAAAVGDSYLVAKPDSKSRELAERVWAPIPSGQEETITLAFTVSDESFPLQCDFDQDTTIGNDGLGQWNLSSGRPEAQPGRRGTVRGTPVSIEKFEGSLQGDADVRFVTSVEIRGDQPYDIEMNNLGGRTELRTPITERLNGTNTERQVPVLMRLAKKPMIAGTIHFLKPIQRRETKGAGSTEGVEIRLKSAFHAEQGDTLAASGRADSFVLSVHTLD
jgi:hypothetical protein